MEENEKLNLECEKLKIEIKTLQQPWWKKTGYLTVVVAMLGIFATFMTSILTGYFDVKNAELGFKGKIDSLRGQYDKKADYIIDSLEIVHRERYLSMEQEKNDYAISNQRLKRNFGLVEILTLRFGENYSIDQVLNLRQLLKDIKIEDGNINPVKYNITQTEYEQIDIKGLFKLINPEQIIELSEQYQIETAVLQALLEVQSSGSGFLSDGRPRILFEGHVFWRELNKKGIDPKNFTKGNEEILFERWTKSFYQGGKGEYERLNRAIKIDREAALKSTSWGMFQTMGFQSDFIGYSSVFQFVEDQKKSEREQIVIFLKFIEANNLMPSIVNKNWEEFCKGYNGPGYSLAKYPEKLRKSYAKFSKK